MEFDIIFHILTMVSLVCDVFNNSGQISSIVPHIHLHTYIHTGIFTCLGALLYFLTLVFSNIKLRILKNS